MIIFFKKKLKHCFRILNEQINIYYKFGILLPENSKISDHKNIELGKNFCLSTGCSILAQDEKAKIVIGDNVALNYNVMINADCGGEIIIGNHVLIGPNVVLRASNHNFANKDIPIREQGHISGKIIIEDNVWIGGQVTVLSNVKISTGSIIAAGSVVAKDVPKNCIYGGVPAKLIKER